MAVDPAWRFVPLIQRGEDWLDPGLDPWLIKDAEVPMRRGIEDAVKRQQALERRLTHLATGRPSG